MLVPEEIQHDMLVVSSPDQEVGEGGGDEDPGGPDVVLGVEEALVGVAIVLDAEVAGHIVALGTLSLSEAVPPEILEHRCRTRAEKIILFNEIHSVLIISPLVHCPLLFLLIHIQ